MNPGTLTSDSPIPARKLCPCRLRFPAAPGRSPGRSSSPRSPRRRSPRPGKLLLLVIVAVFAVALLGGLGFYGFRSLVGKPYTGPTKEVVKEKLKITIVA